MVKDFNENYKDNFQKQDSDTNLAEIGKIN